MIPGLKAMVDIGSELGIENYIFGMAHRYACFRNTCVVASFFTQIYSLVLWKHEREFCAGACWPGTSSSPHVCVYVCLHAVEVPQMTISVGMWREMRSTWV